MRLPVFLTLLITLGLTALVCAQDTLPGETPPAQPAKQPAAEQPPAGNPPAPTLQAASEAAAEQPAAEESPATASEEEEVQPDKKSLWESGAIGLMFRGGIYMWPILLLGILTAGVIIERYRALKMLSGDTTQLRAQVLELLRQDRVEEAMQLCESQRGPVPAILGAGVRKYLMLRTLGYEPAKIEEQVIKAMDDYSVHVVAALERHLPILATVSSVAPMVGFLGTVAGMITSFDDIVAKMGETNIVEAAAAGIGEALLTTAFGLIVGIPAFMAFNYFTGVINGFVLEVEESAAELMESVTLQQALLQRGMPAANLAKPETVTAGQG